VTIFGQDTNNAATFTTAAFNITRRTKTPISVQWNNIPAWTQAGAAGTSQKTPDLSSIIQRIVNKSGWQSGNAIVIIITGKGTRTAEAFDGVPAATAKLKINFTVNGSANLPNGTISFGVIGDYGNAGSGELAVANLVKSWNPQFIITLGDNNYPDGSASTIYQNIGQYYNNFIFPYFGTYGSTATSNAFFPSLGNHDWHLPFALGYLNYFTLPGNERYYSFIKGPVQFFVLDSDSNETDGRTSTSIQGQWLQTQLASSTSPFKIVYFHHAPYSSGSGHGSTTIMQWPFENWGATAVLAGHEHIYERISRDDNTDGNNITYFVNGLGGASISSFGTPIPGSKVRYKNSYGAMLINATNISIIFQFIAINGTVIDNFVILKNGTALQIPPIVTSIFATNRNITVTFDKEVDQATAENVSNYLVSNGVSVLTATKTGLSC